VDEEAVEAIFLYDNASRRVAPSSAADPIAANTALLSAHISRLATQIASLTEAVSVLAARIDEQQTVAAPPPPIPGPEPEPEPGLRAKLASLPRRPYRSVLDEAGDWPGDDELERFRGHRGRTDDELERFRGHRGGTDDIS
jgi:hypothetical protein